MVAFDIWHILATVVAVADMHPKLALVLLLVGASPFVVAQANESSIWQF